MADLIKINQDSVASHIYQVLERYPQVVGAYLFGSALEYCRPDSDIDVALIIQNNSLTEKDRDLLCTKIESQIHTYNEKHQIDIVILNEYDSIFSFKVIKKGKLIYVTNHAKVTDFIEKISRKYAEDYPRYKEALNLLVGGVGNGA